MMRQLTTADQKELDAEQERRVECTRALAAWKEIKRLSLYPDICAARLALRELRMGETRLSMQSKRVGFEKWLRGFAK